MRSLCPAASLLGVFLVACLLPQLADAQYFGKNKVQYGGFQFEMLETEHFDVYFYPTEAEAARLAARLAERWHARLAQVLDHQLASRQPLILYGSQPEFAQTNVVPGLLGDSIGGVTDFARRRVVMPFAPTLAETDHVLGHEIVHAFQFDIFKRHGGSMPAWAIEGMAQYLSLGAVDPETELWLSDAVAHELLPARANDAASRFSPYRFGHAFWAHLAARFGDTIVRQVLKLGRSRTFSDRLRRVTGFTLDELYADFRAHAHLTHANGGSAPTSGAFAAGKGRVRLGPALSPDGRRLIFFSEHDRLSLDLYLTDLDTGRVRKLATTAGSARFESFEPYRSAGAWSPDGRQFVFSAIRNGQPVLVFLSMDDGGHDEVVPFPRLGQVLSPSWSPDGSSIAFAGLDSGFTDLFVYHLADRSLERLTNDSFADLQPAWSPDGRQLAFVSERFSSNIDALRFGVPRLTVMTLASRGVREVPVLRGARHLSPQWATDGEHVLLVADQGDGANVYRVSLATGETTQLTRLPGGVAGITANSPALTVARDAPVLMYSMLRAGRFELGVLKGPDALAGVRASSGWRVGEGAGDDGEAGPEPSRNAAAAAPDAEGMVSSLLHDAAFGVPDAATVASKPYRSRMVLEGIGQPYLSSGGGPLGAFVVGGGSVYFGDLLGNRKLSSAIQVGSRVRDLAFDTRYVNREHRWNWGIVAQAQPSIRMFQRLHREEQGDQRVLQQGTEYFQEMRLRVAGLLAYPLSRARRLEFSAGASRAWYRLDTRERVRSLTTGRLVSDTRAEGSGGEPATAGDVTIALVGDSAVFGPASPLLGSRYRFEVAPTAGDLAFVRVLADYRRYLMPVKPYTLAVRVMHSARYGRDSRDPRLSPTFLGSSYFVRGYGWSDLRCQWDARGECAALDELIGRRLVVGNAELRFPIPGVFAGDLAYWPLPLEGFAFADAGLVWARGGLTALADERLVRSAGLGVRMNAMGMPVEVAVVRALDAPARGWSWAISFRPGF